MQAWEEFATKVTGNTEHAYETMHQAEMEAQKGAAVIFPMTVWIAQKSI
jgi:hypothetical protein